MSKFPEPALLVPGVTVKSKPRIFVEVKPPPWSDVMLSGRKRALDYPDRVLGVCAIASNTIAKAMGVDVPDTPGLSMMRDFDGSAEAMRRPTDRKVQRWR